MQIVLPVCIYDDHRKWAVIWYWDNFTWIIRKYQVTDHSIILMTFCMWLSLEPAELLGKILANTATERYRANSSFNFCTIFPAPADWKNLRIRVPPSVDVLTDKPRIYSNLCTAPPWLCGNPTVNRPTMRPYSKPLTQQEGAGFCRNPLSVRRLSPRRSSTTIKRESDFDPIGRPNIQETKSWNLRDTNWVLSKRSGEESGNSNRKCPGTDAAWSAHTPDGYEGIFLGRRLVWSGLAEHSVLKKR